MKEKFSSPEQNYEQQIASLRKEYQDLKEAKDHALTVLSNQRNALLGKWVKKLGLDKEWRDTTEDVLARMDGEDRKKYNEIISVEACLDQRAFELHSSILQLAVNNPTMTWIKKPQSDSFAGPYNRDAEMQFDKDVTVRLNWCTQPRNTPGAMYMSPGEERDKALQNRLDMLSVDIWERGSGPMGVQGDLGITIARQFGTEDEYQFSEKMKLQFNPEELAKMRRDMVILKEQLFSQADSEK